MQSGIKHLLIATLVVAVTTAAAPNLSAMMPEYPTSIFWITTIGAGVLTRWIGWRICWPPGSVGRHALAFFFTTLGCAAVMVLLSYEHSGAQLVRDMRDGLGAGALIYAIIMAGIIECVFWLLACLRTDRIEGSRP